MIIANCFLVLADEQATVESIANQADTYVRIRTGEWIDEVFHPVHKKKHVYTVPDGYILCACPDSKQSRVLYALKEWGIDYTLVSVKCL